MKKAIRVIRFIMICLCAILLPCFNLIFRSYGITIGVIFILSAFSFFYFRKNLLYTFNWKSFAKEVLLYGIPLMLAIVIVVREIAYYVGIGDFGDYKMSSFYNIGGIIAYIAVFIPALVEEIAFRGIICNYVELDMKLSTIKSIIISSALFGAGHILQVFSKGRTLQDVGIQIVLFMLIGVFYGAVYMYGKKSIWSIAILHMLYNIEIMFHEMITGINGNTSINVLRLFGQELIVNNIDYYIVGILFIIGVVIIFVNEIKKRSVHK